LQNSHIFANKSPGCFSKTSSYAQEGMRAAPSAIQGSFMLCPNTCDEMTSLWRRYDSTPAICYAL